MMRKWVQACGSLMALGLLSACVSPPRSQGVAATVRSAASATSGAQALLAPSEPLVECAPTDAAACSRMCARDQPASCRRLAYLLERGKGAARDGARAMALYDKACRLNDLRACHALGWFHEHGIETAKNIDHALALYQKACDANMAEGCYDIGRLGLFEDGQGTLDLWGDRKILKRTRDGYQRACDLGDLRGCRLLGTLGVDDTGHAETDFVRLARLETTCERGDGMSCKAAASMLSGEWEQTDGEGVPLDPARANVLRTRAIELWEKHCSDNQAWDSCYEAAMAYRHGRGVPKNPSRALELAQHGCEHENVEACKSLAGMHEMGEGVPKDLARSAELNREACHGRDAQACEFLGVAYEKGLGVPVDLAQARSLYERACKMDSGLCTWLGHVYQKGLGVPPDRVRAIELFERSCRANEGEACYLAAVVYLDGSKIQPELARVFPRMEKACSLGHEKACSWLEKSKATKPRSAAGAPR